MLQTFGEDIAEFIPGQNKLPEPTRVEYTLSIVIDEVCLVLENGILGLVLMVVKIGQKLLNLQCRVDLSRCRCFSRRYLLIEQVFLCLEMVFSDLSSE